MSLVYIEEVSRAWKDSWIIGCLKILLPEQLEQFLVFWSEKANVIVGNVSYEKHDWKEADKNQGAAACHARIRRRATTIFCHSQFFFQKNVIQYTQIEGKFLLRGFFGIYNFWKKMCSKNFRCGRNKGFHKIVYIKLLPKFSSIWACAGDFLSLPFFVLSCQAFWTVLL